MNLTQEGTAIELIRFVAQRLPEESIDDFSRLINGLLEHHNQQILEQHVSYLQLSEKARRLGQQRTTFFHILNGILTDCAPSAPGASEAMRTHMLTFRRFLEEHNVPEPTEQEIREKLGHELQSRQKT